MGSSTLDIGHRVYVPAEPHLGLGTVKLRMGKRLTVSFERVEVERVYSADSEALTRYRPRPGDRVRLDSGGERQVLAVEENRGGLTLTLDDGSRITEAQLHFSTELSDPFAELSRTQIGSPANFRRRLESYELASFGRRQELRGLGAARVQLLPHQLYVAERVARMERPRVLLADEVGLGKTIEAGLIAVRMAALSRAHSLLVVAPRALTGQWLAEFYRRFARPLTLFDPELDEPAQDLLVALEDLMEVPRNLTRDLLVVDEAHRAVGPILSRLVEGSRAVLFLTATPSLVGAVRSSAPAVTALFAEPEDRRETSASNASEVDGMEARGENTGHEESEETATDGLSQLLSLLDPLRYRDTLQLRESSDRWQRAAALARQLELGRPLNELEPHLVEYFPQHRELRQLLERQDRDELVARLADRHGLGRSLVRNRRARLSNLFPGRDLLVVPASCSADREQNLLELLRRLAQQEKKALVMVRSPEQVRRWWNLLRSETRLRVARFDESMSLLERDRQAAWFNRPPDDRVNGPGAEVLICSEIGGEGRNFQAAHHLVLLDLPQDPDRLEQRIGRLDRIGQLYRVQVHVLLDGSPQLEVRLAWLDAALGAFERPLAEARSLMVRYRSELEDWEGRGADEKFISWCQGVRMEADRQRALAEESVDPLVDRLSYQPLIGGRLVAQAEREQAQCRQRLQHLLPELWDSLGVSFEPTKEDDIGLLRPSEMMFIEALPGLPEEGLSLTFDRHLANQREEIEFLHFEHRLVQGTLEMVLDEGVGRATAARWRGAPRTTVLFQLLWVLEVSGGEESPAVRFLPTASRTVTVDHELRAALGSVLPGEDAGAASPTTIPEGGLERLSEDVVTVLLQRTGGHREEIVERARTLLASTLREAVATALEEAEEFYRAEYDRLEHLSAIESEPDVRDALRDSKGQLAQIQERVRREISAADWRFDAVRLILCQEAKQ